MKYLLHQNLITQHAASYVVVYKVTYGLRQRCVVYSTETQIHKTFSPKVSKPSAGSSSGLAASEDVPVRYIAPDEGVFSSTLKNRTAPREG